MRGMNKIDRDLKVVRDFVEGYISFLRYIVLAEKVVIRYCKATVTQLLGRKLSSFFEN